MTSSLRPVGAASESVPTGLDIDLFLGFARRFVPSVLIDGAGWRRLHDRLNDVPGSAMASVPVTFEFRLWEREPSADLELTLFPGPLKDRFLDQGRVAPAGSSAAALSTLLAQVDIETWPPYAILEYDVCDLPSGERPAPGLFVTCDDVDWSRESPAPGEVVDILAYSLALQRDDNERRTVEGVFDALPPGSWVNLVGAMPSRKVRAVRVQVEGIEASEVPAFLDRISWPGPIPRAMDTLTDLLSVATRFALALDVAPDGPLPRVGLEVTPFVNGRSCFDGWQTSTRSDWQPLIEHLIATGLCLPEKGEAVLECAGINHLIGPLGAYFIHHAIFAPKITVSDNGVQAKAYTVMTQAPGF